MAVGARLAIFAVMLVTPASAYGDLTASYDGMLTIPKAGEDAIAASGLMQAGASLTGTVAVNAVTEGVSGIYTVSGTVKKTRFKLSGASDKGVAISHRNLVNFCGWCTHAGLVGPGDRSTQFAPYTFSPRAMSSLSSHFLFGSSAWAVFACCCCATMMD